MAVELTLLRRLGVSLWDQKQITPSWTKWETAVEAWNQEQIYSWWHVGMVNQGAILFPALPPPPHTKYIPPQSTIKCIKLWAWTIILISLYNNCPLYPTVWCTTWCGVLYQVQTHAYIFCLRYYKWPLLHHWSWLFYRWSPCVDYCSPSQLGFGTQPVGNTSYKY